jgi:hypothetical protein
MRLGRKGRAPMMSLLEMRIFIFWLGSRISTSSEPPMLTSSVRCSISAPVAEQTDRTIRTRLQKQIAGQMNRRMFMMTSLVCQIIVS